MVVLIAMNVYTAWLVSKQNNELLETQNELQEMYKERKNLLTIVLNVAHFAEIIPIEEDGKISFLVRALNDEKFISAHGWDAYKEFAIRFE